MSDLNGGGALWGIGQGPTFNWDSGTWPISESPLEGAFTAMLPNVPTPQSDPFAWPPVYPMVTHSTPQAFDVGIPIGAEGFLPGAGTIGRVAGTAIGAITPVLKGIAAKIGAIIAGGGGKAAATSLPPAVIKKLPRAAKDIIIATGGAIAIDQLLGIISGSSERRRRMNVLNPRALRRALRRAEGFEKFARRTIQVRQKVRMKRRRR